MRFNNIGTDKIGVSLCNKMGTHSLHALLISHQVYQPERTQDYEKYPKGLFSHLIHEDPGEFKNDKKYAILLRDSFDKWESGYWQEVQMLYPGWLEHDTELDIMWKIHDPMNSWYYINADIQTGNSWMFNGHGDFWKWNNSNSVPLGVYAQLPNIYFLELKDLSNPKFLEWLKEQDEEWESVIKIPHRNASKHFDIRRTVEQLWKEYNEGLILQDKVLVCPFSKKYPPNVIMSILEQEQMTIDFIRNNHERYLRFE
jgi:hypothetical protein